MTLIIEDGSIVAGANSYVAVADVTTYAASIGDTAWAASTTGEQEAAILRAMRYVEGQYLVRWKGIRRNRDQALAWPRADVFDSDGYDVNPDTVPLGVRNAICEAALREEASPNGLNPDQAREAYARSESVTAGPVSRSRSYGSDAPIHKSFPQIEASLKPYIKSSGNQIPLKRGA